MKRKIVEHRGDEGKKEPLTTTKGKEKRTSKYVWEIKPGVFREGKIKLHFFKALLKSWRSALALGD